MAAVIVCCKDFNISECIDGTPAERGVKRGEWKESWKTKNKQMG